MTFAEIQGFVVQWLMRLAQIFLDILYRPPKSNKVSCYSVLYHHKSQHYQPTGAKSTSSYLRKFTCTRDVEWLSNKDVHLFGVSGSEFVFWRSSPGVDIHNITEYPFLYSAKLGNVEEFGVISADLALDLVRERKDDGSNIGYLHNLGRCGSTLVANMVHKTGRCQVLSEPGVLLDIATMIYRTPGFRVDPRTVAILRAALLFLAKSPDTRYFIKIHSFVIIILPLIHKALPGIREAFMYRAFRPMYLSTRRVFKLSVFKFMFKSFGFLTKENLRLMENRGADNIDKFFFHIYLEQTKIFIDECASRDDLVAYSYESLLADPKAFISHLLDHIGVGSEFAELALTAMKEDSQKNSWLSKKEIGKRSKADVTIKEEDAEFTKELAAREFGITLEGENLEMVDLPNRWRKDK